MKKLKSALLLIFLLCLLPVCTALAKTGRVTASSLNMRKSASSDSKVVGTLREGDKAKRGYEGTETTEKAWLLYWFRRWGLRRGNEGSCQELPETKRAKSNRNS